MEIKSLRSKRYVFYIMLLVLIVIDIVSINYFSKLLYISNQYMHSNRYEILKNFHLLINDFAGKYSNADVMVKIKQHELTDFLQSSDCSDYAIFNGDYDKLLSSANYEITKNDYLIIKRIHESNIDARHYLGDFDSYYMKIRTSGGTLFAIMRFRTDMTLTQTRIRTYFIFKILIMLCIIIVGIMLVRALEEPLRNISYIAKKLGLSVDADNSEHITNLFRDSIEEIAEMGQNEKIREQEVRKRIQGAEKRIIKKEGLQQLSSMSSGLAHQINNNLASVKGMLEIAKQHNDMDKVIIANREIDRLIQLTSKFMEFSRQGEVYKEQTDIILIMREEAIRSSITLRIKPPDIKLMFNTDPLLFEELMRNIFDNIKKYARSDIAEAEIRDLPGIYKIHIGDKGPGLPGDIIENPYKPFAESAKGFGLGIPTVLKISNMLNIDTQFTNGRTGTEVILILGKHEDNTAN